MKSRWMRPNILAAMLLVPAAGAVAMGPRPANAGQAAHLRADGKLLYQTHCARCHGDDGSDTELYPNVKSLVDVTQRYGASDILEKSKGFASADLTGRMARHSWPISIRFVPGNMPARSCWSRPVG